MHNNRSAFFEIGRNIIQVKLFVEFSWENPAAEILYLHLLWFLQESLKRSLRVETCLQSPAGALLRRSDRIVLMSCIIAKWSIMFVSSPNTEDDRSTLLLVERGNCLSLLNLYRTTSLIYNSVHLVRRLERREPWNLDSVETLIASHDPAFDYHPTIEESMSQRLIKTARFTNICQELRLRSPTGLVE